MAAPWSFNVRALAAAILGILLGTHGAATRAAARRCFEAAAATQQGGYGGYRSGGHTYASSAYAYNSNPNAARAGVGPATNCGGYGGYGGVYVHGPYAH